MNTIKQIDKDHNGYVTRNELDDIIKNNYPKELEDKNIMQIINKFGSIQNKILIDYKAFKTWLISELNKTKENKEARSQLSNNSKIDNLLS